MEVDEINVSERTDLCPYIVIGQKLDSGKFSVVRDGYHEKKRCIIAVKIINMGDENEILNRTTESEIAAYEYIQKCGFHRNILGYYGYHINYEFKAALLFLEKGNIDLFSYIRKKEQQEKHMSDREKSWMCYQMVEAMEFCRQNLIFHRDIKIDNFILFQDLVPCIKLADFGFAVVLKEKGEKVTNPAGTIECMAPEVIKMFQAEGRGEDMEPYAYGYNADLWSLGVAIYEVYTFCSLFYASGEEGHEGTIERILRGNTYILRLKALPKEVTDFVLTLMKRIPEERRLRHNIFGALHT